MLKRNKPLLRKTPLKRSQKPIARTPLKRSLKPINKKSDKQKDIDKEYLPIRKKYLEDHEECEVKFDVCSWKAIEIHHTYMGSNKRRHYTNAKTFKATCRNCHDKIDKMSTEELVELGLRILE